MSLEPDLTGLTPVEVDTQLAAIHLRIYEARRKVARAEHSLDMSRRSRFARPEELATAAAKVEEAEAAMAEIVSETVPYDAEFVRRGRWTRAFLVTSSNAGHVHSSLGCSTCRITTEFIWLPEYSGVTEDKIVSDAGERACTACYPTAPVEVRAQPTRIFSPAEKQAVLDRQQREQDRIAREAARAEKAISNQDGTALRVDGYYGDVKTERTAQSLYVERRADQLAAERGLVDSRYAVYSETVPVLLAALAHKRGLSLEAAQEHLSSKVEARIRRDFR